MTSTLSAMYTDARKKNKKAKEETDIHNRRRTQLLATTTAAFSYIIYVCICIYHKALDSETDRNKHVGKGGEHKQDQKMAFLDRNFRVAERN